jgi:toxin ParE1/3/4
VTRRFHVVWTEAAARDYEAVLQYVASEGGALDAARLDKKLDKAIAALDTSPGRCRVVPELRAEGLDAYRELIVRPFRIMSRIRGDAVVILAVVDARRDLAELLFERALAE